MTPAAASAMPLVAAAPASRPTSRVLAVDGLRGLAALLVVMYHLHGAVSRSAADWLWAPFDWIAAHGYLGVDIFFVISGFVIALSVSRGALSLDYLGRFVLRRSIRLDPPYWTAIALELLALALTARFFVERAHPFPTVPQLTAHLVYAQGLLGYEHIVEVFWTLCYEIQFYVGFVTVSVIASRWSEESRPRQVLRWVAALVFLLSLWAMFVRPGVIPDAFALRRWYQFALGVLVFEVVGSGARPYRLLAASALVVLAVLVMQRPLTHLTVLLTVATLVLSHSVPSLARVLAWRPLLALGAISYSIYLYHSTVGWRLVSLLQHLFPGAWSPPMALACFGFAIVVSVAVAALLWWLVERPMLQLCRRVGLPTREGPADVRDGAAPGRIVAGGNALSTALPTVHAGNVG